MKKKIMSIAMMGAILCFGFSQAQADKISFDPTGGGGAGAFDVDTFDWLPSSALAVDVVPIQGVGDAFTLHTYGSLGSFVLGGNAVNGTGLGTAYELTFVAGFGEKTTTFAPGIPGSASFTFDATNPVNYFEIYIDAAQNSDNSLVGDLSSGTGFEDGTLILSGNVTQSNDGFFVFSADAGPLDQVGPDEFSAIFGQTDSVGGNGGGATDITALVNSVFIDPNYFPDITGGTIGFAIDFNTSFITPFNQVDPASNVWDATAAGGAGAYITPNVGALNGFTGPDFLFQVDANQSFNPVPEPTTMLLFGAGLIGLAGIARRKRSNK